MNLINGKIIDSQGAKAYLDQLPDSITETLMGEPLPLELVMDGLDRLSKELNTPEVRQLLMAMGYSRQAGEALIQAASQQLTKDALMEKVTRELGNEPFEARHYQGYKILRQPLGVLTHITPGNSSGLPAMGAIEGLLAGNINLIKLPEGDPGLSTLLLLRLVELAPSIAPYLYVFDFSSKETHLIQQLLQLSDGAAVWGSEEAIGGVRRIAPPGLQLIEWGHRISFGYVTKRGATEEHLQAFAQEIAFSEQLLCSAPQVLYYEADSWEELLDFAQNFASVMDRVSSKVERPQMDPSTQGQISLALRLAQLESLLQKKQVFQGEAYAVIVEESPALKPSLMYRNVLVKPGRREEMFSRLMPHRGVLQTVGLACGSEEAEELQTLFIKAGLHRVVLPGHMTTIFPGFPHDGVYPLARYTRQITVFSHGSPRNHS